MSLCAFAQTQSATGDTMVMVPQRYVSAEGMQHQGTIPNPELSTIEKWKGIGQEIGIATKEGLTSVMDVAEKFGTTNVGRFVMFMVAWKVMGQDAMAMSKEILVIVLGTPIWFLGVALWIWSLKKFHLGMRVLVKEDKTAKAKEWTVQQYEFKSDEARACVAWSHGIFIFIWCFVWICEIFG